MLRKIFVSLAVFWFMACAHTDNKPEPHKAPPPPAAGTSIEAKELAAEEQAPYVTEFKFRKGEKILSAADMDRVKKFLDEAKAHGEITGIQIISWADKEYPAKPTKHLSLDQVTLAKDRANTVAAVFHGLDKDLKIETLNMADRPSRFAEWFDTKNAQVKNALEAAGIPHDGGQAKSPPKASHAIVLLMLKKH